ncbi:hypothetical protein [Streptomyces cucumeris]|uniref:hypothetical protein n=1 Tax=Streptomyces cucumeris TaxID=2962890 RepID=UPI0020C8E43B|nr:hypothetical protein [Streptomyces sp. NEAU-Y11]MCP9211459.1 hypothetical protein [Streptomyces sp. NEAU-Y11]
MEYRLKLLGLRRIQKECLGEFAEEPQVGGFVAGLAETDRSGGSGQGRETVLHKGLEVAGDDLMLGMRVGRQVAAAADLGGKLGSKPLLELLEAGVGDAKLTTQGSNGPRLWGSPARRARPRPKT